MRLWVAAISMTLILSSCSSESSGGPGLEIYLVADSSCQVCERADFLNPYVDSPFLVERSSALSITAEEVLRVAPVRIEDQVLGRTYWTARLELDEASALKLERLVEGTESGQIAVLKIGGPIIGVAPVSHLRRVIELGRFDSRESLCQSFPKASDEEVSRTIESDPDFDSFMERIEMDLHEDERLSEEAKRLIKKLEEE